MIKLIQELKLMVSEIKDMSAEQWKDMSAKFAELENVAETTVEGELTEFKTPHYEPSKDVQDLLSAVLGLVTLNRNNINENNQAIFGSAIETYNQLRDMKVPQLASAAISPPPVSNEYINTLKKAIDGISPWLSASLNELNAGEDYQNSCDAIFRCTSLDVKPVQEITGVQRFVHHQPPPVAPPPFSAAIPEFLKHQDGNYDTLNNVLTRAFDQASKGKGKERHAQDLHFDKQPMQIISDLVGSADGLRYQAIKKIQESKRLSTVEHRVAELLGAIVYIAGTVIYEEKSNVQ